MLNLAQPPRTEDNKALRKPTTRVRRGYTTSSTPHRNNTHPRICTHTQKHAHQILISISKF